MAKSADAFRTISEVAEWLEVPAHVLRFWESKFTQVKPVKRAGGRRYYRPADMRLLGGIKLLLHDEGMTIKGVQKILREEGVQHVAALSQGLGGSDEDQVIEATTRSDDPPAPAQVLAFERPAESAEASEVPNIEATEEDVPGIADEVSQDDAHTAETADEDTPHTTEQDADYPGTAAPQEPPTPNLFAPEATPPKESFDAAPQDEATPAPEQEPKPENMFTGPEDTETPNADDAPQQAAAVPPLPELPEDPADTTEAAPGALTALALQKRPISPMLATRLAQISERLRTLGTQNGASDTGRD